MGLGLTRALVFDHEMSAGWYQSADQIYKFSFEPRLASVEALTVGEFEPRIDTRLNPRHDPSAAATYNARHQWCPRRQPGGIAHGQHNTQPTGAGANLSQVSNNQFESSSVADGHTAGRKSLRYLPGSGVRSHFA